MARARSWASREKNALALEAEQFSGPRAHGSFGPGPVYPLGRLGPEPRVAASKRFHQLHDLLLTPWVGIGARKERLQMTVTILVGYIFTMI